jgi:ABC-type branched-subunit amino acid transport system ATPase component
MQLSDRVVVLNSGRKIVEGTPREVISNPLVIQAYLGDRYRA